MAIRVVVGAVIAAVVMFAWGFVFWGLSGATNRLMSPLPDSARDDVIAVLRRENLPPGMYVYPGPPEDMQEAAAAEEYNQLHEDGPRIRMAVKEGGPAMPPSCLVLGVVLNFAVALFGGMMIAMAGESLRNFGRRFGFLALYSMAGAMWTNLGDVIWWFHPVNYAAGNTIYLLVSGLLMALVVAAIVRPAASRE